MSESKKDILLEKLQQIEAEMKVISFWSSGASPADPSDCKEAFCADKMSFEQWLQFIFLPHARKAIKDDALPTSSMVGAQASREYSQMSVVEKAQPLVSLLSEFDALVTDSK